MQVSIKWLKDYIDFTETPAQLADKLTMAGIPVENIIDPGEGLEKVVTGRIEKLEPHQNSDHLQICTMNVGLPENIIIVTGAQNVAEGQVVPVAMVGAHLPNGMKISKGKLRGVASNGMLCSAQELKLDLEKLPPEQKTGIFILPPDTPVGIPAKDVLGLNDVVLEFELTANRADCFSVVGLVREIAAITGNKPHFPEIKFTEDDATKLSDIFAVEIADPDLCSRFSTRMLKNVKIGPSPEWMQQRLEGAGIRSINNVVDVTNFVMIELGHPMHAYDYDQIAGQKLTRSTIRLVKQKVKCSSSPIRKKQPVLPVSWAALKRKSRIKRRLLYWSRLISTVRAFAAQPVPAVCPPKLPAVLNAVSTVKRRLKRSTERRSCFKIWGRAPFVRVSLMFTQARNSQTT